MFQFTATPIFTMCRVVFLSRTPGMIIRVDLVIDAAKDQGLWCGPYEPDRLLASSECVE